MSLEENKALIRRFVEEVQCQHNLAALDELFSPDFVDHIGMTNPPTLEGSRQFFSMMFAAFPDMRFVIRQQIAEGDLVAIRMSAEGTFTNPLMGIPPNGKKAVVWMTNIWRFADGKIVEWWSCMDTLGFMQLLGAIPPLGR